MDSRWFEQSSSATSSRNASILWFWLVSCSICSQLFLVALK
jgi:hypothetical protein